MKYIMIISNDGLFYIEEKEIAPMNCGGKLESCPEAVVNTLELKLANLKKISVEELNNLRLFIFSKIRLGEAIEKILCLTNDNEICNSIEIDRSILEEAKVKTVDLLIVSADQGLLYDLMAR